MLMTPEECACAVALLMRKIDLTAASDTRTCTYVGLEPLFPQGNVRNILKCLRAEKA